jgi:hypothetical protein
MSSFVDEMLQGYIVCALWSTHDDVADPEGAGPMLDENYGPEDISDGLRRDMREDCQEFYNANFDDIMAYAALMHRSEWTGAEMAGHDFWLTRNHHGAGFWDRGLGDLGERLTVACKPYGEVYIGANDDGKIYS